MKLCLVVLVTNLIITPSNGCYSRNYGQDSVVCVCNSSHCDTIPRPEKLPRPFYIKYTSNRAGLRFQKEIRNFTNDNITGPETIIIDHSVQYQEILGWGGAFTDSTGITVKSLDEKTQDSFLRSYFSPDGIEYNQCRVPIGGTDFSTRPYSYNDGPSDKSLKNFQLAPEDLQYKIPLIHKALHLSNNTLRLFASAWTAPKWMKTNGQYVGGFIKQDMYQAWADYYIKFLQEYDKVGIKFWGLTTGNEPSLVLLPFLGISSVGWTPWGQSRWIANNLGPTIRKSRYSSLKIMVLDDQRYFLSWFVDLLLANKETSQYVDGTAVHWYGDLITSPGLLTQTHEHFPDKFILGTEASTGFLPFDKAVRLGSWRRGEAYSNHIIQALSNWVTGWTDWSMSLDLTGGPTYINNNIDSPIIVNSTAGEFYKQPMFYNMGHFTKFIPRGSVRIGTIGLGGSCVAFLRPDNGTVLVILNRLESTIRTTVIDSRFKGRTRIEISPKSITTLLYW